MPNNLWNGFILVRFESIGKENYKGNILIIIRLFIFLSDFPFIFRAWKKEVTTAELKTTIIKSKQRFLKKRRCWIKIKQTMTSRGLTQRQLNFARVSKVCIDIIKLPLEDILNIFIKPTELIKNIKSLSITTYWKIQT